MLDGRTIGEALGMNVGLDVSLSSETISGKSGFVLSNDRVEYNHLFEDLVEDMKAGQAAPIMKEIFGNSGDWMFA